MRNDSYVAEHWNNQFEPNDSREESIMECNECGGTGKEKYSDCCGADIIKESFANICSDCKAYCEIITENCDTCKGDGVVNI